MSDHYIADNDNTAKVYFDIDPRTVRFPRPSRITATSKTVAGAANAARVRTTDFGAGTGNRTIEIICDYVLYSTYNSILAKFDYYPPEQIIYSPDNGTTKYLCSWDGEDALLPLPDRGVNPDNDALGVQIKLRVQAVT